LCSDAQAVTAANAYVTVSSSTYGVEDIVPVGADFYVTTRNVGKPSFRADISVRANSPYYLVIPANGRMNLGIGESGLYRVKDESGNEDVFSGRVYVLKLDIEPAETNVCWKSTSCTLKLTDDSYPGGTAEWTSSPAGISGSGDSIAFSPNALKAGVYTVTARSGIVTNYADTCIVRCVSSKFIIYVDQPGAGGDRDPYELGFSGEGKKVDLDVDVGHAFWAFNCSYQDAVQDERLRYLVNKQVGYYPSTTVSLSDPSSPGRLIVPDIAHLAGHEVDHMWEISLTQLLAGLRYSRQLLDNPGTYNLNSNNCTDAALGAAAAVGIFINATTGTWQGGGGHNSGDLGEDLRNLGN
jgi:hypothetical protein